MRLILWPALVLCAQIVAQTPPATIDEDDLKDAAIIQTALEHSPSIDDLYKSTSAQADVTKQADEMVAASQRRIVRAQKRLEEAQAALPGGKDPNRTLDPLFKDVESRLQTGYDVLDRATILKEIVATARIAMQKHGRGGAMVRYDGNRKFSPSDLEIVSKAFEGRFRKPLPISAEGQTSTHAAMGFDHRGKVDVALSPDQTEGLWLCSYLRSMAIPYFAFRRAVPGSATSAHIHIGPGSKRIHEAPIAVATRKRHSGRSSD